MVNVYSEHTGLVLFWQSLAIILFMQTIFTQGSDSVRITYWESHKKISCRCVNFVVAKFSKGNEIYFRVVGIFKLHVCAKRDFTQNTQICSCSTVTSFKFSKAEKEDEKKNYILDTSLNFVHTFSSKLKKLPREKKVLLYTQHISNIYKQRALNILFGISKLYMRK